MTTYHNYEEFIKQYDPNYHLHRHDGYERPESGKYMDYRIDKRISKWASAIASPIVGLDDTDEYFVDACLSGDMLIASSIYEIYRDAANHDKHNVVTHALYKCCERSLTKMVKWIYKLDDFRNYGNDLVDIVCTNGNLDLLKFFHSMGFNIHHSVEKPLKLACINGHLEIVQWLDQMNSILDWDCLEESFINNRKNIINWMIYTQKSRLKDIVCRTKSTVIDDIFVRVCDRGFSEMVLIMYHFLTTDCSYVFQSCDTIFYHGSKTTNRDLCKLFYHKKKPIQSNAHEHSSTFERNYTILVTLCSDCDVKVVKWFLDFCESMGDPIDIVADGRIDCFYYACKSMSYNVAKWLFELNPTFLFRSLHSHISEIIPYLGLSPYGVYILSNIRAKKKLSIDLVRDIDEIALFALCYYKMFGFIRKLQDKFPAIVFELDDDEYVNCYINSI